MSSGPLHKHQAVLCFSMSLQEKDTRTHFLLGLTQPEMVALFTTVVMLFLKQSFGTPGHN